VPARLLAAAEALCFALASFEPALLSARDCATVAEALSKTEKACAAARARAGARAVAGGEHRSRGYADGADWLAARAGTTVVQARSELEAAKAVEALAATSAALSAGEVSLAQAAEVARAEAGAPGSEAQLLGLAKRASLGAVRDEARKAVLAVSDVEAIARRRHEARSFRHWRNELGMVCFAGALPPEVGVGLANRIDAEANRLRREGRRTAGTERFEAYAADALVAMLKGKGKSGSGRTDLSVVCDINAFRRGHAHPGEACHIIAGGPVTVGWVREASKDAFIKAVLHDGVDILAVAHYGRHMKAELRTALELGKVPDFDGVACNDCERRYGLEWDHIDPVANNGQTSYKNLRAKCGPHHWEKTERDRQAGLLGPRAP